MPGCLHGRIAQGQQMLADHQVRQNELPDTLLRIRGAIQVLEERMQETEGVGPGKVHRLDRAGAQGS